MRVTLKKLSELTGVSSSCISNILNGKTEEYSQKTIDYVKKVAKEQNYRPNLIAKSMITRSTMTIGLILPDISNTFYPEVARGIEDKASELGYTIIYLNTYENENKEKSAFITLEEKMVDGVLFIPSVNSIKNKEVIEKFNFPIVAIDRYLFKKGISATVIGNDYKGSKIITEYLLKRGRKKVLFLNGDSYSDFTKEEIFNYYYLNIKENSKIIEECFDRVAAFFDVINKNKIDFSIDYFMTGMHNPEFGYNATKEFLKKNLIFDSVYACSDMIAIGVLKALKESNLKVPEDISVIGYDNIYISQYLDPPLTTMNQPKYEMGVIAVEKLVGIIKKKQESNEEITFLEPNLIIRESV